MKHVALVVVVCGLAIASTAAVVGTAFFGPRSWLTWLPLVVGLSASLLGALAGLRSGRSDATFSRHRLRLLAECGIVVATAVLANVAALQRPIILDVTSSRRNTLSEMSVTVARALKEPVTITAQLEGTDRAWTELQELVERYQRESPLIRLERHAPPVAEALAGDARVTLSAGDRRERVRFVAGAADQEVVLTRALRFVSLAQRARAYVLAGHGEPGVGDDDRGGLRRLGQALVDQGLEVVPLPLAAAGRVPEDAALLILASPTAVPPREVAQLQQYLDGGGRLLVLLEPFVDDGLSSLLGSVGIQADDDVVIDPSAFSGILGGPETATGMAYAAHPITTPLGATMTHFPRARSLSVNPGTPTDPIVLVQTGAEAFGEMTRGQSSFDDADVKGPVNIALAAVLSATTADASAKRSGRIVVIGDVTCAQNQAISLGANQDFLLNAAMWLLARDEDITVRPHGRGGNLLLLSPRARERIAFVLLYGLPVSLLCAGLSVTVVRRRR